MTSILTPDAASWSNERRYPCRSHMEERFCVVVTWTNTPASLPYERPCPRRALHDKNTASQISHPCERVVDSRICQHFFITSGNSSQKTTFNLIRCTPPATSNFVNAEAQKPIVTTAGRCMDRQCSQQKSTAPATHEYQTGVGVDNHRSTRPAVRACGCR